ncbi:MAG TPA: Rrf2 family transcriptional regulator [Fibrobacteria bacterium]|nr:Rrf2 family transcriptional regulator [Fibrobacteria bacterium]
MKFTKKTDYALRTMEYLARQWYEAAGAEPLPVPVQFIAERAHLSLRFLQGIVSKLSKARLLRTVPGVKGGIMLQREPEAISILQIIEAVEGRINLMGCMEHPEQCGDANQCSIMGVLHTAQGALTAALANSNLKLMVNARRAPFNRMPEKHFLKPRFGCPVLK